MGFFESFADKCPALKLFFYIKKKYVPRIKPKKLKL